MASLPIRKFGDPVLRQKTKPIKVIDAKVQTLIDDMIETMRAEGGVGLAAPQVGETLRLTVIETPDDGLHVFINPEIIKRTGQRVVTEGCLSLPGWYGEVTRSTHVMVRARDRYGKEFKLKATELLAQAIEHEVDHLDGVLFTDRLVKPDSLWQASSRDEAAEKANDHRKRADRAAEEGKSPSVA